MQSIAGGNGSEKDVAQAGGAGFTARWRGSALRNAPEASTLIWPIFLILMAHSRAGFWYNALHGFNGEKLQALHAQNMRFEVVIRFLKLKLQAALGKYFGSSSEKISPDQPALELGADSVVPGVPGMPEAETEEVVIPRKNRKHRPLKILRKSTGSMANTTFRF